VDTELLALADTAGTTAVALLVTDAFGKVKAGLGRLWSLVHPDRAGQVEDELEQARTELISAWEAGDASAEQALVAEWQNRLRRLLRSDPDVAVPLRQLLDEVAPALPQAQGAHVHASRTGSVVQTGGGVANTGVVMGNVAVEGTGR
jgi:hypothetical protein